MSARRLNILRRGWHLLAIAAAMTLAWSVHAQTVAPLKKESSVTLFGGYRWGGSLTDENTGTTLDVGDAESYALSVDIGIDRRMQVQLFYSRQETGLTSATFSPTVDNFGLTIEYYHIGGIVFMHEVGAGNYVVVGFGATHARPDSHDLHSETFASANLGIGYMLPLGKHAGLRFEARGYGTLLDNDSTVFCSDNGGCLVTIKGRAMYQGEVLAGVSVRF